MNNSVHLFVDKIKFCLSKFFLLTIKSVAILNFDGLICGRSIETKRKS